MLGRLRPLLGRRNEREERERFFASARPVTPYVAVEIDGCEFILSTADPAPGGRLFSARGKSEFTVLRRAAAAVPNRGVFLDVGANIGTSSLPALQYFERVIAVEAEPRNAKLMRANAALNGLGDRVTVVEAACSNAPGTVELRLSAGGHGGHAVRTAKPGSTMLPVRATTMDLVVAEQGLRPEDIGLVWMDVEGYEDKVVAGAAAIVAAGVPMVIEARARTAEALTGLLAGYRHFVDLREEDGESRPLAELSPYLAGLGANGGRRFTDILVVAD